MNWITAGVVGTLLLIGGNGGVVWAETRVASGLAALLIATEPFWIVLLDWLRPGGRRPGLAVAAGLLFGFIGVGLLVSPFDLIGGGRVDALGAGAVVLASLCWAIGSLYTARGARLPASPVLATGMEMLIGGALFFPLSAATGEWATFSLAAVSLKSALALLYLIVFGAIVAFTAYVYLLRTRRRARVHRAYVNPVIASFSMGVRRKAITGRVALAAAAIIAAVVVITDTGRRQITTSAGRPTAVLATDHQTAG